MNVCLKCGDSFFYIVCEKGNVEIVKFLFSRGVDVNFLNSNGLSLLYLVNNKK